MILSNLIQSILFHPVEFEEAFCLWVSASVCG